MNEHAVDVSAYGYSVDEIQNHALRLARSYFGEDAELSVQPFTARPAMMNVAGEVVGGWQADVTVVRGNHGLD